MNPDTGSKAGGADVPQTKPMHLTEGQYFARSRALATADALKLVTEAIGADRKAEGPRITGHLKVAQDALLDGLSLLAESEGVK